MRYAPHYIVIGFSLGRSRFDSPKIESLRFCACGDYWSPKKGLRNILMTPARDAKRVFVVLWKKNSGRKRLGGDIWKETFEKASRESHLGGDI